ncbi:L-2-hydroxyglutarate oxidase [Pengzhenrongella frigida]|uniref:L-2-hydroxyglutarate oxidase n=1 Tax=Pengzhenrongella frigida TaxID=1259133 RepID=UPI001F5CC5E8|nr:L-2-hydroxyglutarate oxidase [Cellulomonas sp. HLT2-17]
MARVVVIGAGIVGLAVAARLAARGDEAVVIEKEGDLARHQTGRNSGVIHSGLYYAPGSLKAEFAAAGARTMVAFAREHEVEVVVCGKLVVATSPAQLPALRALAARADANGVPARLISAAEAREYEPHVRCVGALRVESTGSVDYAGVCRALSQIVTDRGGEVRYDEQYVGARTRGDGVEVRTARDVLRADALVACAGLHADRAAVAAGVDPGARIVPFRGEYFELTPEASTLVNGLIYPVPDPRFPFLGVHLTRMIHGGVHAGPNAVLALAREGYRWREVNARDVGSALSWPGLWRMGAHNVLPGAREVLRSLSRRRFAASLAELVPGITAADLVPAPAGVRAQALSRDGSLVDDFLLRTAPRQVHVINAPSPAATAALQIAERVVRELDAVTR